MICMWVGILIIYTAPMAASGGELLMLGCLFSVSYSVKGHPHFWSLEHPSIIGLPTYMYCRYPAAIVYLPTPPLDDASPDITTDPY
ncbi:hypothetical protein F5B18DRAFT_318320 [Nemania serpens]|nr:hypothetical protein F5B18DRAFT_318320 [Nemania serpens]